LSDTGLKMREQGNFWKTYNSVRQEVLYSIPIEFGIPMKLVRVTKMSNLKWSKP
jgi:hypothetical protein